MTGKDIKGQPAGLSTVRVNCADLSATAALAGRLAPHLRPGDIVLLDGPMAAGKTAFVALLCRALGMVAPVSSPTYVIVHVYEGKTGSAGFDILHIDAYRLAGPDAFADLGLEEYFDDSVTLIEWGERVAPVLEDHLHVRIDIVAGSARTEGEARRFTLSAHGPRWRALLSDLQAGMRADG